MSATLRKPVRYHPAGKRAPGGPCDACGQSSVTCVDGSLMILDRDHCHEHGWIRGHVCPGCNVLLSMVDRLILPTVLILPDRPDIEDLLLVANNCPECEPLAESDLIVPPRFHRTSRSAGLDRHVYAALRKTDVAA